MVSTKRLIDFSKKCNPKPGVFPDYIIENGMLIGWIFPKAIRGNKKTLGRYKNGNWSYQMELIKQFPTPNKGT